MVLDMSVLQPKFLSKKEREALALQRRQEAVTGQKSRCALCKEAGQCLQEQGACSSHLPR